MCGKDSKTGADTAGSKNNPGGEKLGQTSQEKVSSEMMGNEEEKSDSGVGGARASASSADTVGGTGTGGGRSGSVAEDMDGGGDWDDDGWGQDDWGVASGGEDVSGEDKQDSVSTATSHKKVRSLIVMLVQHSKPLAKNCIKFMSMLIKVIHLVFYLFSHLAIN